MSYDPLPDEYHFAKKPMMTTSESKIDVVFTCPLCEDPLKNAVGNKSGEDSVECEGSCAT